MEILCATQVSLAMIGGCQGLSFNQIDLPLAGASYSLFNEIKRIAYK